MEFMKKLFETKERLYYNKVIEVTGGNPEDILIISWIGLKCFQRYGQISDPERSSRENSDFHVWA